MVRASIRCFSACWTYTSSCGRWAHGPTRHAKKVLRMLHSSLACSCVKQP